MRTKVKKAKMVVSDSLKKIMGAKPKKPESKSRAPKDKIPNIKRRGMK